MQDEIELNGKKYVLKKKVEKVDIEYFESDDEAKLHKQLKKLLNEDIDCLKESDLTTEPLAVMDPANVAMVISKSERAKTILRRYINPENPKPKIPELDYDKLNGEEISARYSLDYLIIILNFLNALATKKDTKSAVIKINNDYPMTIENQDFKIILAPRVEND